MKISVLTPTYNRGEDLNRLYTSLIVNNNSNVEIEWLIMDDGSNDRTRTIVTNFIKQNIINNNRIEFILNGYHYYNNSLKAE